MATLTRVFEFDAAHRVMHEKMKCYNLHGHRFRVEVTFSFMEVKKLGYAIDFKEIKRIAGTWIDEHLDHACILNPKDTAIIQVCKENGLRTYIMGFGEDVDVNPSAEALVSELSCVISELFSTEKLITLENVRLYETPSCWVDFAGTHLNEMPQTFRANLHRWREVMGEVNYDSREDA